MCEDDDVGPQIEVAAVEVPDSEPREGRKKLENAAVVALEVDACVDVDDCRPTPSGLLTFGFALAGAG